MENSWSKIIKQSMALKSTIQNNQTFKDLLVLLQNNIEVKSIQDIIDKLEIASWKTQLNYMQTMNGSTNEIFISSDMFYIEIQIDMLAEEVFTVKVAHNNGEPIVSNELLQILKNNDFKSFTSHLNEINDLYQINSDKKQKNKTFLALNSLETDLLELNKVQISISDPYLLVMRSPLGVLTPRKGGIPMKLTYFVSPFDLVNVATHKIEPLEIDNLIEKGKGRHVYVYFKGTPDSTYKIQTSPVLSLIKSPEGKILPHFVGLNSQNSAPLNVYFLLDCKSHDIVPQHEEFSEGAEHNFVGNDIDHNSFKNDDRIIMSLSLAKKLQGITNIPVNSINGSEKITVNKTLTRHLIEKYFINMINSNQPKINQEEMNKEILQNINIKRVLAQSTHRFAVKLPTFQNSSQPISKQTQSKSSHYVIPDKCMEIAFDIYTEYTGELSYPIQCALDSSPENKGQLSTLRDEVIKDTEVLALPISNVPFTHPTHIPQIINILRQQCVLNALLESCLRTYKPKENNNQGVDFVPEVNDTNKEDYKPLKKENIETISDKYEKIDIDEKMDMVDQNDTNTKKSSENTNPCVFSLYVTSPSIVNLEYLYRYNNNDNNFKSSNSYLFNIVIDLTDIHGLKIKIQTSATLYCSYSENTALTNELKELATKMESILQKTYSIPITMRAFLKNLQDISETYSTIFTSYRKHNLLDLNNENILQSSPYKDLLQVNSNKNTEKFLPCNRIEASNEEPDKTSPMDVEEVNTTSSIVTSNNPKNISKVNTLLAPPETSQKSSGNIPNLNASSEHKKFKPLKVAYGTASPSSSFNSSNLVGKKPSNQTTPITNVEPKKLQVPLTNVNNASNNTTNTNIKKSTMATAIHHNTPSNTPPLKKLSMKDLINQQKPATNVVNTGSSGNGGLNTKNAINSSGTNSTNNPNPIITQNQPGPSSSPTADLFKKLAQNLSGIANSVTFISNNNNNSNNPGSNNNNRATLVGQDKDERKFEASSSNPKAFTKSHSTSLANNSNSTPQQNPLADNLFSSPHLMPSASNPTKINVTTMTSKNSTTNFNNNANTNITPMNAGKSRKSSLSAVIDKLKSGAVTTISPPNNKMNQGNAPVIATAYVNITSSGSSSMQHLSSSKSGFLDKMAKATSSSATNLTSLSEQPVNRSSNPTTQISGSSSSNNNNYPGSQSLPGIKMTISKRASSDGSLKIVSSVMPHPQQPSPSANHPNTQISWMAMNEPEKMGGTAGQSSNMTTSQYPKNLSFHPQTTPSSNSQLNQKSASVGSSNMGNNSNNPPVVDYLYQNIEGEDDEMSNNSMESLTIAQTSTMSITPHPTNQQPNFAYMPSNRPTNYISLPISDRDNRNTADNKNLNAMTEDENNLLMDEALMQ